jgi:thymidylate synthase
MKQYHDFLQTILAEGWEEPDDRTGVGRKRCVTAPGMVYDLRDGFPIVTTKNVPLRWIFEELRWFLSGDTNEATLRATGVDIWKEWADLEHTSRFGREEGDLGPVYGYLWRSFGGDYPNRNGVDQIARLLKEIKTKPASTRMLVSGWDPRECDNVDLPPCHTLFQFFVERGEVLHLKLYQRSADAFLGVPFNISSYALLLAMVAHVTGLKAGKLVHETGDAHVYFNHMEQVATVLGREPFPLPTLEIVDPGGTLFDGGLDALLAFRWENLKLHGYQNHGRVPAPVAV